MKEIIEHKIAELEAQGLNGSAEALVRQGQVMAYKDVLSMIDNDTL